MSFSRLRKIRLFIGLILLPTLNNPSRRRVRYFLGKPDGLLPEFGNRFWLYWDSQQGDRGTYYSIGFDDDDQMTGWDMLFAIEASRLIPFDPTLPSGHIA